MREGKKREWKEPTPEQKARWKEIQRKLRSGEIKIAFADKAYIDSFRGEVREVLAAFGVNAMVSDLSRMSDFDSIENFDTRMERVRALGIEAEPADYVYEVARRLHEKRMK